LAKLLIAFWSWVYLFLNKGEYTMTDRLIGVNELSEVLGVLPSWIYARTRETGSGTIPRIMVGKYVKFRIDDVMAWLEKKNTSEAC
jgi:predicted DNA-binding transcriptional regulator AlpA